MNRTPAAVGELPRKPREKSVLGILRMQAAQGMAVIIAGTGVSAVASLFMAKLLSPVEFGVFVFTITLLNYGTVVARGGMDSSVVRYINQYASDAEMRRAFVHWARKTLVAASLASAALAIVVGFIAHFSRTSFPAGAVVVAGLGLAPLSLVFLYTSLLRAEKRILLSQTPLQVLRPTLGILLAWLVWMAGYANGLTFAVAEVAGLALMVVPLMVLTRHFFTQPAVEADREVRRDWLKTTRGITIATVSQQLIGQADILMVGMCYGMRDAGIYGLASRLGKLVVLGNRAANSIAAPIIAEAYHNGDKPLLQEVVGETCTLVTISTLVMAAALFAIPDAVFAWLGKGFGDSRQILMILVIGQVLNAATGPVGTVLLMTGHQRELTINNIVFGIALVAGIYIASVTGGSLAVAAALFGVATATSNIAKGVTVYRYVGVRSVPRLRGLRKGLRLLARRRR